MIEVPAGEPIDFLSLGMGVQSSELGMKAARGELRPLGYRVQAAIFADTQAEPDEVYEWIEVLTDYMEIGRPAPRSACVYCPYHSDEEWLRIRAMPNEWKKVVQFDRALRVANAEDEVTTGVPYLHDSRKPIEEVVFQPRRKKEGDDFEAHCEAEGMCGL